MEEPKFTIDNMMYQMCISSTWAEEYDMTTSTFTEYCHDGTIHRKTFETNDIPMDTELHLLDKFSALELISKYFDDDEIVQSAMCDHDTFATMDVDGHTNVLGWNNRSK